MTSPTTRHRCGWCDNAPVFPQPSVRLELSEAAEIGAQLPLPSAVDFDAGSNGACEYRLEPPADDDHPYFLLQATPRRR